MIWSRPIAAYALPMAGMLTCPDCGNSWEAHAYSEKSRCRSCKRSVYVPMAIRNRTTPRHESPPARQRGRVPGELSLVRSRDEAPASVRSQVTPKRSGPDLFDVLGGLAERFVAARAAQRSAAVTMTPARSVSSRLTVPQHLVPPVPQVSRFIAPGRPAYRLIVSCGCPFGWDTPDTPDVVVCPKHGNTRVASGSSSETWDGGPLPLAVPVEP